jgi:hypothetical protein
VRSWLGEVDDLKGISPELDRFFEEQERREKVLKRNEQIGRTRTAPVAIRLHDFTIRRLKAVAAHRNTGYQTLLKEFVAERLYEEERRLGIIQDRPPEVR